MRRGGSCGGLSGVRVVKGYRGGLVVLKLERRYFAGISFQLLLAFAASSGTAVFSVRIRKALIKLFSLSERCGLFQILRLSELDSPSAPFNFKYSK